MIGTRFVVGGTLALLLGLAGARQGTRDHRGDARMHPMRPVQAFRHPGVQGVTMTPDGSRLVSWSEDGTIRVWDLGGPAGHPPPPPSWQPPPHHGWGGPPPPHAWGGQPWMQPPGPPPFPVGPYGTGGEPMSPDGMLINQPPGPSTPPR